MEFEQKILEINDILRKELVDKKNIIIRGGGEHTEKLFCMTCILEFWNHISIVDRYPHGSIGNKVIKGKDEIQWDVVDAVIISSLTSQNAIEKELLENKSFKGSIIKLYNDKEVSQFFELQKEYDFLTLKETESWEEAVIKSGKGYSAESILEYDYNDFKDHLIRSQNNVKFEKRLYYDVLFYILKMVVQLQKKEIKILDFGGGFGNLYYDFKYYLKNLDIKFEWIIIEQDHIVDFCKSGDESQILFKKSLNDIDREKTIDLALLGSSIQYLDDYKNIIQNIIDLQPNRVVFLKTPVSDRTFVTVQQVNAGGNYNHYVSSYPCRVIDEKVLIELFLDEYRLEDSTECIFNSSNNYLNNCIVKWKDLFFERRSLEKVELNG